MFQAAEACTSAHFPFYLVISQKRLEFMFTLRKSISGIFSELGENFSHLEAFLSFRRAHSAHRCHVFFQSIDCILR